jgi:hypothetical protein
MTIKEAYEAMKDGSKVFWTWTMPDGHLSIGRGVITGIGPSSVSLSSDGLSAGDASDSVPLRMVSFVTKLETFSDGFEYLPIAEANSALNAFFSAHVFAPA